MHAPHFSLLVFALSIATALGVHHDTRVIEVDHVSSSSPKVLHEKIHQHKTSRKLKGMLAADSKMALEHDTKDVLAKGKQHHDESYEKRSKHPMFLFGERLIHNAKVVFLNATASSAIDSSDSFVLADQDANLIVKGHSDGLKLLERRAGPDICLAKAQSLLRNKLDTTKMCSSLPCTAAYTLAYTLGLRHDLPTQGCQMIWNPKDAKHASLSAKSTELSELVKDEKSQKSGFVFFCNAKYPKLIPSVLLQSGFAPVQDKPGFWRANSSFPFPKKF